MDEFWQSAFKKDDFLKDAFVEESTEVPVKKNHKTTFKRFVKKLVLFLVFLAVSVLVSLVSKNNLSIEKAFMLLHIPVLLCGFVCGGTCGFFTGALTVILRYLIFPSLSFTPDTMCLCFELSVYGCISGYLYNALPKKSVLVIPNIAITYCVAKIAETAVYFCINTFKANADFDILRHISDSLVTNLPGLAFQIVALPIVVAVFKKFNLSLNE